MSISDAESTVMEVLWRRSPCTAEEIIAALAGTVDWQPATIKTLINRLLRKRAIEAERDGRRYRYRPLLARAHYLAQRSGDLVDRLFDGRIAPLVAHFTEHRRLSRRDISDLRKLLEDLDHD
ncbi:MAG: BlaI/MecI/CopY family transcriptional regulator [Pseudomonadota bacterium]|jgi:BlaI family penicillinase repressor